MEADWNPMMRKSTAPARPGVKTVKSLGSEISKNVISVPAKGSDVTQEGVLRSHGVLTSVNSIMETNDIVKEQMLCPQRTNNLDGLNSSSLFNQIQLEAEPITKSYSVKVVNSSPLSLFELKQSCKLNFDDFVDMKILNPDLNDANSELSINGSSNFQIKEPKGQQINSIVQKKEKLETVQGKKFRRIPHEISESNRRTLIVLDKNSKNHKLQGHRQDVNNSQGRYFVMAQGVDGTFLARPVDGWFTFEPSLKYKTLTEEEADKEFERRDKLLNYFSVMVKKRLLGESNCDENEEEKMKLENFENKKRKTSNLEDVDSEPWIRDSDSENEDDMSEVLFQEQIE